MARLLFVLAILTAAGTGAAAQTEYRLGPGGEWAKVSEPEPGTDAAITAQARALLAQSKFAPARRMMTKWIDEHKFTDSPYLASAYLARGDARTGAGDEYLALYDYEEIFRDFRATQEFVTAMERELAIAIKYVHGMNRKFLGIRWYGAESEGVEILVRVGQRMPYTVLDEQAEIELIQYYYRKRDLGWAATMCDIFMQKFPRSAYRAMVLEYRIKSNWGLYAGPEYDGSFLIESRELIRQFMAEFPAEAERTGIDEAAIARIDESAAQQLLSNGMWYLRRGQAASARYTLHKLVREWGQTVAASRGYQVLVDKGWTAGITPPGPADEPAAPAPAAAAPTGPADRTPAPASGGAAR